MTPFSEATPPNPTLASPELQKQEIISCKSAQQISPTGRIVVSKMGWVVRIGALAATIIVAILHIAQGIQSNNMLVVYSTIVLMHSIIVFCVGWFFYRNPAKGKAGKDLVTVIIPVYNQKGMIEVVIDAIFRSTYKNIEVIAVNDGSKDGTKELLDKLAKKYAGLKVVHKKNEGKRKAVASGFSAARGKYVVLIDSDSVVDENAITEFMKAFHSDPKVGAVVGQAKVWNANKNFLTRCQDAWYDYAFNIYKICESTFGSVTCCSGCLAGYRREAIEAFIPYWAESKIQYSDDRALTNFAISPPSIKKQLASPVAQHLMESTAKYDDSEDRLLTIQSLVDWKALYVASATVYTDAPEKLKGYLRQQQRWKKGYIRSNFFASAFFWKKHPLMALVFYTDFMVTFTLPLVLFTVFFYEPVVGQNYLSPLTFTAGLVLMGLAQGFDYKFRDTKTKNWKYKPIMNLISAFILSWMLFPAILTLKKNTWLTR